MFSLQNSLEMKHYDFRVLIVFLILVWNWSILEAASSSQIREHPYKQNFHQAHTRSIPENSDPTLSSNINSINKNYKPSSQQQQQVPQQINSFPNTVNNSYYFQQQQQQPQSGSPDLQDSTNPSASGAACSDEVIAAGKCSRPMGLNMKRLSLELIRHDILRKLRLDERNLPNVSATAIPTDYLTKLTGIVDMQNDSPQEQYDDDHATTEKVIAFSRTQQVKVTGKGLLNAHYFTFSDKLTNMGIDRAVLHILVKHHGNVRRHDFYIRVMQLVSERKGESPVFNNYGPIRATFRPSSHNDSPVHIRHDNTRWIQLDVRNVFGKFLANTAFTSSRKMGLLLDVTDERQNPIHDISVVSANDLNVNENPFFEVEVSERGKIRMARNIGLDCLESFKETRCCRYPLTVDFDEFGWDWVIAPKQYEANYCSGECPMAFLQRHAHNHIVQQVVGAGGIGGPCCTARKLSPITMLHFDHDTNIVFSVLPGMLVDQCGCS